MRDWTRWWARCAVLGADLAVLGALGRVGRGIWPCWARWAGLGVGFGSGGGLGTDLAFCVWSTLYVTCLFMSSWWLFDLIDSFALFGVCAGVIPMIRRSWGSKSRLTKAAGAESCLQRRNEQLHAAVARSAFSSQHVKKRTVSDHFLKLVCRKMSKLSPWASLF